MSDRAERHCEDDIVCPYCGREYEDSWEWGDGHEGGDIEECDECGKKFHWYRRLSVSYNTDGDCELNGEKHDYEWVDTGSKNGGAWFCKKCPKLMLDKYTDK